jgi:uncharacterized membrane protein
MLYVSIAVLVVVAIAFVVVPMERSTHRRKMELVRARIERRERQLAERGEVDDDGFS